MSRRGALALVSGGAVFVAVITAGQTIGGFTRQAALLLPRGRTRGDGPNDFQINRTAWVAGITPEATGERWRLTLTGGPAPVVLDRAALIAMPQHTARLPIALRGRLVDHGDLDRGAAGGGWHAGGVPNPASAFVRSVERGARSGQLQGNQIVHPDSLLALRVNDADLSPDHGFPARIIVPALPGVHNTKWVGSIDFRAG
jgi:DMSO/TMAO reductase YedYZ molybdopterin-dependent catalytic subunit